MPIEVRELIIRARVEDPDTSAQPSTFSAGHQPQSIDEQELHTIVNLCVEKVISILKRQKVR
ncbi:MAG: DUF5908 family protein [Bacteroidota bacterium]